MAKSYYREILSIFIPCVGAIAMLSAFVPGLLNSVLGLVLAGGVLISVVLMIIGDMRSGRNVAKSLTGLLLIGVLTYVMVAAPIWYFSSLAQSGQLFDFSSLGNIERSR